MHDYLVCYSGVGGDYVRYPTSADDEVQALRNALNSEPPFRLGPLGVVEAKVFLLENPHRFSVGHEIATQL